MARMDSEKQQREISELERLLAGGIAGETGEPNPFGPVEQRMNQQMMAATGANLSETWARKMIAHHQGAVDMSELLVRQGGNPQVVAMARKTAEEQRGDIAHLEAMLRGEPMPSEGSAAPATSAAATKESSRPTSTASQPEEKAKATPTPQAAERTESTSRPAPTPATAEPPKATCAPEHRAAGHC